MLATVNDEEVFLPTNLVVSRASSKVELGRTARI
jgi:hypothetical protein